MPYPTHISIQFTKPFQEDAAYVLTIDRVTIEYRDTAATPHLVVATEATYPYKESSSALLSLWYYH